MGVNVDTSEWEEFSKKIATLKDKQAHLFYIRAAKLMAAALLALVIPRTPVGKGTYEMVPRMDKDGNPEVYKRDSKYGKKGSIKMKRQTVTQGGTLRRGWTSKTEAEAQKGTVGSAEGYAMTLDVNKVGALYQIEVINPVSYASYVEYGHRQTPGRYVPAIGKRLKASWVEGRFFLTVSEETLKTAAPALLEKELETILKGVF
jgi:hypothetical protein